MFLAAAVTLALTNNPSVLTAKERLAEASAQASSSYSQLFPTILAVSDASYKKDSLIMGNALFGGEPYNVYGIGFEAVQPIFRGGATWSAITLAQKEYDIRALELKIVENQLTVGVIDLFYKILLAQHRLDIMLGTEKSQKESLALMEQRLRIGRDQDITVLQQRTQVALLKPKILEAQHGLRVAASELATMLGTRDQSDIEITGSLAVPALKTLGQTLENQQHKQASSRFEIQRMQLMKDRFQNERSVTLSKHWPQLDAIAGIDNNATEKTRLFDVDGRSWVVGFRLTIPLFSGLSSIFERRVFSARSGLLEADDAKLKDQIALEQVNAERTLEYSHSLLDAAEESVNHARAAANSAHRNLKFNTGTHSEFFEANRNLLEAQLTLTQARYEVIVGTARYAAAFNISLQEVVAALDVQRQ